MAKDSYVYEDTNVLINHLGIRNQDDLSIAEADIVWPQFTKIYINGLDGELTPDLHRAIHKQLFGKIYPFAGQFRTIAIGKANEPPYANPQFLESNATAIYAKVRTTFAQVGDLETTISRLADTMGDLHMLHPFREGNTRTLQLAIREIAWRAGYDVAWLNVDPQTIRPAGVSAGLGDMEPYRKLLASVTTARTDGRSSKSGGRTSTNVENTGERK